MERIGAYCIYPLVALAAANLASDGEAMDFSLDSRVVGLPMSSAGSAPLGLRRLAALPPVVPSRKRRDSA